jgi:cytoskeletal protein CcmA (bactofilin family)
MSEMSTLGKTTVVRGEVHASENLTIDGTVEGHVICEFHAITLSESAKVTGEVIARDITIAGQANGQMVATDVVDVRAGASVTGQVLAPRFILDGGAFFKGRVEPQHVDAAIRVAKFNRRPEVAK